MNSLVRLISRVCHESREVALDGAYKVGMFGRKTDPITWETTQPPRYYYPNIDIEHTNYDRRLLPDIWPVDDLTDGEDRFFFRGVKATVPRSKVASFNDFFIAWIFRRRSSTIYLSDPEDSFLHFMDLWEERSESYLVSLYCISMHPSLEEARASNLFGAWLEERIQTVDAQDTVTLERYFRLWKSGPAEDWEAGHFFEEVLSDDYLNRLECWICDLKKLWVLAEYKRTKSVDENFDREDTVWLNNDPIPTYNPHHLWVIDVLEDMPQFTPTIMFRLCHHQCYVPNPDDRDSRNHMRQEFLNWGPRWSPRWSPEPSNSQSSSSEGS